MMLFGAKKEEPPEPEPWLNATSLSVLAIAAAALAIYRSGPIVKHYGALTSSKKRNIMISSVGYLAVAGLFLPPVETYLSVETALKIAGGIYAIFCLQFLFLAQFFFSDNFKTKPKDNFGLVSFRMVRLPSLQNAARAHHYTACLVLLRAHALSTCTLRAAVRLARPLVAVDVEHRGPRHRVPGLLCHQPWHALHRPAARRDAAADQREAHRAAHRLPCRIARTDGRAHLNGGGGCGYRCIIRAAERRHPAA